VGDYFHVSSSSLTVNGTTYNNLGFSSAGGPSSLVAYSGPGVYGLGQSFPTNNSLVTHLGFEFSSSSLSTVGSSFLPLSGQPLSDFSFNGGPSIYFNDSAGYSNASITSYSVTSAVPEPSTYAAIMGLASVGFVMIRRRFVRKQVG
jgi:hypothetical protein